MALYDKNETMKLIGQQNVLEIVDKYKEQFQDVMTAHTEHTLPCHNIVFEIGLDFFMLGFMLGKQVEREKKTDRKKSDKKKWIV